MNQNEPSQWAKEGGGTIAALVMAFRNQTGGYPLVAIAWAASIVLALIAISGCSSPRQPATMLRSGAFYVEPVLLTPTVSNGTAQVFYRHPNTNDIWFPEWSTNMVDWTICSNTQVFEGGLRVTETSAEGWERIFFRLRRR